MKKVKILAVIMCVTAAANFASADIIRGINIDFVTIGNAGNPGDTRMEANPNGCGAVGYNYRIGKYEITNTQWNAFTAAAGVPTGNDGGYGYSAAWTGTQQPVNNITWYSAVQFCNYLTSGDKSKGAYLFSGNNANPGSFLGIDRETAKATWGTIYILPTENEWYKSAFYTGGGYSLYANGTSTAPIGGVDARYASAISPWNVGTGTQEQNGTFDMMADVWEWNETLIDSFRGIRGGSYYNFPNDGTLSSSDRRGCSPNFDGSNGHIDVGFRIASVPEPATLFLLGLGGLALLRKRIK